MQFGLIGYRDEPDYHGCVEFIVKFTNNPTVTSADLRLLRENLEKNQKIGKTLLVIVRLFYWNYITIDELKILLDGRLTLANFQLTDLWEKQEIYHCLGSELLNSFFSWEFPLKILESYGEVQRINVLSEKSEWQNDWCYVPPNTGFFSVVENIIMAKFFFHLNGRKFLVDGSINWWRYPIKFFDIFADYVEQYVGNNTSVVQVDWKTVRDHFRYVDPSYFETLRDFKISEYSKIKKAIKNFISSRSINYSFDYLKHVNNCVYFIRGGDKTLLETVDIPIEISMRDLKAAQTKYEKVVIISDDFRIAQDIVNRFGTGSFYNATDRNKNGYYINSKHAETDVYAILNFYLLLSEANMSISCPSSNLVNSAHWSNEFYSGNDKLYSTPLSRLLYL